MGQVTVATSSKDSLTNIKHYESVTKQSTKVIGARFLRVKGSNTLIPLTDILSEQGLLKLKRNEPVSFTPYSITENDKVETVSDLKDGVKFEGFNDTNVSIGEKLINNSYLELDEKPNSIYLSLNGKNLSLEPETYYEQNSKEDSAEEKKTYYKGAVIGRVDTQFENRLNTTRISKEFKGLLLESFENKDFNTAKKLLEFLKDPTNLAKKSKVVLSLAKSPYATKTQARIEEIINQVFESEETNVTLDDIDYLVRDLNESEEIIKNQSVYSEQVFLEKEKITPPAFKKFEAEDKLFNGHTIKVPMLKIKEEDGTFSYVRNASVNYVYNEESKSYDAVIKVKGKEPKIIKNVAQQRAELTTTISHVTPHSDSKQLFTVHNEDGTESFRIEVREGKSSPDRVQFHEKGRGRGNKFEFLKGEALKWGFPVEDFKTTYNAETETLTIDLSFVDSSKLIIEDGKIIGLKDDREDRLFANFPHGIKFEHIIEKEEILTFYEESTIFKETVDDHGNVTREIDCDIIQTSDVNEEGYCSAYDYTERTRVFEEFKKNVEECKRISNLDAPNIEDIKKLQDLQNIINGQLSILGDLESAKLIDEKHKILQEEKAKTGADRDQSKIDQAQKEYEDALKNVGYYKDAKNLATIDDIIARYQNGEFFPTFFFDEQGRKIEINSGDLTEISSCLPYDWSKSKTVESIIGNDKISFNKDYANATVAFNSKAKEVATGSMKVAGALLNATFTMGVVSLLIAPVTLALAGVATVVGTTTYAGELIRKNVKQYKINHLTPQDIKDKQDKDLEETAKKEFEKILEQYNQDIKKAKKIQTSEDEFEKLKQEALTKLTAKQKEVYSQYVLASSASINSSFNMKDKKVTNQNLYGFAELRRQREEAIKGKPIDEATQLLIEKAKEEFKTESEFAKRTYTDKVLLKEYLKTLEVKRDDVKNKYLSINGPLKQRESYFKKTYAYYMATDDEKQKLLEEFKEKNNKVLSNISVETVEVKGAEGLKLEKIKDKFKSMAEEYLPRDLSKDQKKEIIQAVQDEPLKVTVAQNVDSKGFGKGNHKEETEVASAQEKVQEYSNLAETINETISSNDKEKMAEMVDELTTGNKFEDKENWLRKLLKDDEFANKILEDKDIWAGLGESKARGLELLIKTINKLKNNDERAKYVAQLYANTLRPKIKEEFDNLTKKFEKDAEVSKVLTDSNIIEMLPFYIKPGTQGKYSDITKLEAKLRFLQEMNSNNDLNSVKSILLDLNKKVEAKKEQEKNKTEQQKISARIQSIKSWISANAIGKWLNDNNMDAKDFKNSLDILRDPNAKADDIKKVFNYFKVLKQAFDNSKATQQSK